MLRLAYRTLDELAWPAERLGEAIALIADRVLPTRGGADVPVVPAHLLEGGNRGLGVWIEEASRSSGLDAETLTVRYSELPARLRRLGPTVWPLAQTPTSRFLVTLPGSHRHLWVLTPDRRQERASVEVVRQAVCNEIESREGPRVDRLLEQTAVPESRRARARRALMDSRLSFTPLAGAWTFSLPAGAAPRLHARIGGWPAALAVILGAHSAQYLLGIASWWLLGRALLGGRLDAGWLQAWALVLLTTVPFVALARLSEANLALSFSTFMRRRLLAGILKLAPEEVRSRGVGQLLGQVIESQAFESLALTGGLSTLIAAAELIVGSWVLRHGAGGLAHVLLLVMWLVLTGVVVARWLVRRREWSTDRLSLTHDLIEKMSGYRTRLVQQHPSRWHEGEDQALERYLALSRKHDAQTARLLILAPRGWLLVGLVGLTPALVGGGVSLSSLAVGLGGVLLTFRGLSTFVAGLLELATALIAWSRVGELFDAAGRREHPGAGFLMAGDGDLGDRATPLLEAERVSFRHRQRGEPVLRGCCLRIDRGDRVLLEGASGSGKSTLVSLMTGLRPPDSGILLVDGLDWMTLGSVAWRQRVASAPQFHENHIFSDTLAFNLLMGRRWPPHPEDLREADSVCRELGLGSLLDRMPAGIFQTIGETGWQLSHGERSRVFIARAILQKAGLLVFDESFGALDPENLDRGLRCVLARAPTLLVVVHS